MKQDYFPLIVIIFCNLIFVWELYDQTSRNYPYDIHVLDTLNKTKGIITLNNLGDNQNYVLKQAIVINILFAIIAFSSDHQSSLLKETKND